MITLTSCETFNRNSEIAWQAMHVIDAAHTVQISKNPNCQHEKNFLTQMLIGKNPNEDNVYKWWGLSAIAHYFIFKWIDKKVKNKKLNIGIRSADLANKLDIITKNHKKGIRIDGLSTAERIRCYGDPNSINFPIVKF